MTSSSRETFSCTRESGALPKASISSGEPSNSIPRKPRLMPVWRRHCVTPAIFGLRPSAKAYPEARVAALKALELDESNAAAHDALADVKQGYDWDLAGAQVEFKRALKLNPSNLLTRLRYAENLTRMKKYDEAIEETARTSGVGSGFAHQPCQPFHDFLSRPPL